MSLEALPAGVEAARSHEPQDTVPVRRRTSPAVEAVPVADETVVYDCEHDVLHLLDPVASAIWDNLAEVTTVAELAGRLAESFDAPAPQVLRDVRAFVARLERIHLLEPPERAG